MNECICSLFAVLNHSALVRSAKEIVIKNATIADEFLPATEGQDLSPVLVEAENGGANNFIK